MNSETIKVLLIDDDEDDYILTRELLAKVKVGNYTLDWASSYEEGLQVVGRGQHHVCLVDYRLGERSGVQLIREAWSARLTTAMILLTGHGDRDVDMAAMQAGATDYLVKDKTPAALLERTIRHAVELITERRKLEEQLRQAQKMEAIGTLAGGIAHDFNNILGAIIGHAELAQREIAPDNAAQAHLEQVLTAGTRAGDLVRQILTFSRPEELEREALRLQPIIDESLKLLRASLPSTIEIRQQIDAAAPAVMGDGTQMQQVIMNLCANAGQAMNERGDVLEIRLSCLDIDHGFANAHPPLKEGPHVCLEVSDTGGGMDHTTQARIFEPFFTTKNRSEGIGLSVVHAVINNHGGAVVVSSELGVGSTFSVYLPVIHRQPVAVVRRSNPAPQGNGEHILFVDDEEALVLVGKSMLEYLGYRVTSKTDSVEALAAFRAHPGDFDLVITDQTMPGLTGADLARELLQIRPALPVILATGYCSAMTPEKAQEIGISEFLLKPNTMQVLGDAIRRALGQIEKN